MSLAAVPDVPSQLQTFLAFDFGTQAHRRGRGQPPAAHRHAAGHDPGARARPSWPRSKRACAQWQPDALVVGVPFHPDGASHDNTVRARKFARQLRGRLKLPVFEVDERYSTTEALADGRERPDAGAACIILEQFLRSLP